MPMLMSDSPIAALSAAIDTTKTIFMVLLRRVLASRHPGQLSISREHDPPLAYPVTYRLRGQRFQFPAPRTRGGIRMREYLEHAVPCRTVQDAQQRAFIQAARRGKTVDPVRAEQAPGPGMVPVRKVQRSEHQPFDEGHDAAARTADGHAERFPRKPHPGHLVSCSLPADDGEHRGMHLQVMMPVHVGRPEARSHQVSELGRDLALDLRKQRRPEVADPGF